MTQKSVRLYNPGPINVSDDTFAAMSAAMIGHRGNDFVKLYEDIHPKLQALFGTDGPVYLSTSSAWGVMEASVRNLTQKKVLNCLCRNRVNRHYENHFGRPCRESLDETLGDDF